jgi:phage-related protein
MEVRFYKTSSGRCPLLEFLRLLSKDIQEQFADAVQVLEEGKMISMPISRPLSGIHRGLHELRLKDRSGIYRVFYFIKATEAIYMLHGFKKTTQVLPRKELTLMRQRIKEL